MKQCPRCRRNLGELDLACPLCGFELLGGGTSRPGSPIDDTETIVLGGSEASVLDDTDMTLSGDAETSVRGDLTSLLRETSHRVDEEPEATTIDVGAPSEPEVTRGADARSDVQAPAPAFDEPRSPEPAHGFSDAALSLSDAASSLPPDPPDGRHSPRAADTTRAWQSPKPQWDLPANRDAFRDVATTTDETGEPATGPLSAQDDEADIEFSPMTGPEVTRPETVLDVPAALDAEADFSSARFETLDDLAATAPLDETGDRFVAPLPFDGRTPVFETSDPPPDADGAVEITDVEEELPGALMRAGAAPPPPRPPAPATNRRLPLLLGAVATLGALVFIGMPLLREAPEAPSSGAAAAAGAASTMPRVPEDARPVAPAAAVANAPVKWSAGDGERWTGGRRRAVAFELQAENLVPVWLDRVRPVLVVRCLANNTDVFVVTESAARIEPQDERHTVTLSFDGEAVESDRWPDSAEHDALFAPDGQAMAKRLASAQVLRFGFTPHNAAPVTVEFDVHGFDTLVDDVSKTCRWR